MAKASAPKKSAKKAAPKKAAAKKGASKKGAKKSAAPAPRPPYNAHRGQRIANKGKGGPQIGSDSIAADQAKKKGR